MPFRSPSSLVGVRETLLKWFRRLEHPGVPTPRANDAYFFPPPPRFFASPCWFLLPRADGVRREVEATRTGRGGLVGARRERARGRPVEGSARPGVHADTLQAARGVVGVLSACCSHENVLSTRRHPAHPVSVLILFPREIRSTTGSCGHKRNYDTEVLLWNAARGIDRCNAMPSYWATRQALLTHASGAPCRQLSRATIQEGKPICIMLR